MKPYKKPIVLSSSPSGLIPAMLTFISPIAPIVAGAAAVASIMSKKGNSIIDSTHTGTLTARKDFGLI